MKKIIEKKFIFIFLIELGLYILSKILFSNIPFIHHTLAAFLFALCGYKLNCIIEKSKIITHEKAFLFSAIEIAVWGVLVVLLKGINQYVYLFIVTAFYICLFTIMSTLVYLVIESLNKKNKNHIKIFVYDISLLIIFFLINLFKNSLENPLFSSIISLYFTIGVIIFTFYVLTFVSYKIIKANSQ